jgi:hypothetical protein
MAWVIACVIVLATVRTWLRDADDSLVCVISSVDGEKYCVREREKVNAAADLLAMTSQHMTRVVNHCAAQEPDDERVQLLIERYRPGKVKETLPTSEYTAYSENKGEKLAFCMNTAKKGGKMIDPNTLTFVAIHELAHVMTVSVGHTKEFWENFKFLLIRAVDIGVYSPVDYEKHPARYCGMNLTNNPYFS